MLVCLVLSLSVNELVGLVGWLVT